MAVKSKQFTSRKLTLPKVNMRLVSLVFSYVWQKYNLIDKPFSKEIFFEICKGENIGFIASEIMEFEGCYYKHPKGLFIFIQKGFTKKQFLEVAGHELGHHFLNHLDTLKANVVAFNPDGGFNEDRSTSLTPYAAKMLEIEADYFASLLCGWEVEQ